VQISIRFRPTPYTGKNSPPSMLLTELDDFLHQIAVNRVNPVGVCFEVESCAICACIPHPGHHPEKLLAAEYAYWDHGQAKGENWKT